MIDAIGSAANAIGDAVQGAVDWVSIAANGIGDAISKAYDTVGSWFSDAGQAISDWWNAPPEPSQAAKQAIADAQYLLENGATNFEIAGTPECPRVRVWALSRPQLEEMGVKGIVSFWHPATEADRQLISATLGLPRDEIFFGKVEQLGQLCSLGK